MRSALAAALAAIFTLGPAVSAGAQQQNLENVQVRVQPVQGNVYLLAGAGGNITLQIGRDGVLMVDTEFGPLAQKIMTEVQKLSKGPIRYIINTHVHHTRTSGSCGWQRGTRQINSAVPATAAQDHRVPFVTTTDFKKESDDSRWNPTPCSAR